MSGVKAVNFMQKKSTNSDAKGRRSNLLKLQNNKQSGNRNKKQSRFKKCWEIVVNSIKPSKSVKPDNSNLIVINDLSMNGVGLCILVYTGTQSVVISKAAVDKIGD